jgi:hypothetical protein
MDSRRHARTRDTDVWIPFSALVFLTANNFSSSQVLRRRTVCRAVAGR